MAQTKIAVFGVGGVGGYFGAMLARDIADGKPSELEAINGAIVRFGKELGVPTPANGFVYAALLPQETRARAKNAT